MNTATTCLQIQTLVFVLEREQLRDGNFKQRAAVLGDGGHGDGVLSLVPLRFYDIFRCERADPERLQ